MATLKASDAETATNWIEENKESLLDMNTYSENFNSELAEQDPRLLEVLKCMAPPTM